MFGCKNAIRTLNQIKNRTTLNHLNASASLILFNNPIMVNLNFKKNLNLIANFFSHFFLISVPKCSKQKRSSNK